MCAIYLGIENQHPEAILLEILPLLIPTDRGLHLQDLYHS